MSTVDLSEFHSARMLFRAYCVVALERKLDMRQVLPIYIHSAGQLF